MPLTRMLILAGLGFLGAVAVFMGIAVAMSAFAKGSISYSFGEGANLVTRTASLASEPGLFWQRLTLLSFVPAVLGCFALYACRRGFRVTR